MGKVAFLLIAERGYLEKQSVLLVKSIRQFGGDYANSAVYFFSPRNDYKPSAKTIHLLQSLGAIHINEELNTQFSDYGFGNKPFVCEYAENELDADTFIFLDSDQLLVGKLDLSFLEHYNIGITPVEQKKIGTSPSAIDLNFSYWNRLYNKYDIVCSETTVKTIVDCVDIYPYFNAGLLIVKNGKGIFTAWKTIFVELMNSKAFPGEITFMDQVSLSISLVKEKQSYIVLPVAYNYPLPMHDRMPVNARINDISLIKTIHYHKAFATNQSIHPLDVFNGDVVKLKWLKKELKRTKIYPVSVLRTVVRKVKAYLSI